MRHQLPPRANLDHLKKQAKDLQAAHGRAEPEALARIRDALPAFRGQSDDAIARAPFALHDAQSAIAREYGSQSWSELRDKVAAQATAATAESAAGAAGLSDELLRALMPLPFPAEVGAALRDAGSRQGKGASASAAASPFPDVLPVVALRNALFVPGAIGPINIARPASRAAVDAVLARRPPTVAIFAQRAAEQENVDAAALYPVGCEALIQARVPDGEDRAWVVLEGVRWIALESLATAPGGYMVARVSPVAREEGDPAEVEALAAPLRARMRDLASAFPDGARLVALVDEAAPDHLANVSVAHIPGALDTKARYAAEPRLVERLRIASALVGVGA